VPTAEMVAQAPGRVDLWSTQIDFFPTVIAASPGRQQKGSVRAEECDTGIRCHTGERWPRVEAGRSGDALTVPPVPVRSANQPQRLPGGEVGAVGLIRRFPTLTSAARSRATQIQREERFASTMKPDPQPAVNSRGHHPLMVSSTAGWRSLKTLRLMQGQSAGGRQRLRRR